MNASAADARRLMNQARAAVGASIFKHVAEKGTDNVSPQILEVMGMTKKSDAAE